MASPVFIGAASAASFNLHQNGVRSARLGLARKTRYWFSMQATIFIQLELYMSFAIYLLGFAILIGGVAWALIVAGVPQLYVVIACVILLGIGILTGVARTRGKDPS